MAFCCSVTKACLTLHNSIGCSPPGFSVLHCLPELAQVHVHWVSDAILPSHPLPSSSPFDLNLSQHQDLFQWPDCLDIKWPKYWRFNFSISPSNEYSGLISFRIDCFDLLAVPGTLKSLLQHHNFTNISFSCFWGLGSQKSKYQKIQCLVKANFLVLRSWFHL